MWPWGFWRYRSPNENITGPLDTDSILWNGIGSIVIGLALGLYTYFARPVVQPANAFQRYLICAYQPDPYDDSARNSWPAAYCLWPDGPAPLRWLVNFGWFPLLFIGFGVSRVLRARAQRISELESLPLPRADTGPDDDRAAEIGRDNPDVPDNMEGPSDDSPSP